MVKHGYQGSFAEEISEFELNYNEFALRTYDPQIGRWTTADPYDEFASPYLGMGTDPANNVDLDGGSIGGAIWAFFGGGSAGAGCAATAGMSGYGYVASTLPTAFSVTTITRVLTVSVAIGGSAYLHGANQMIYNHMSAMQGANGSNLSQSGAGAETGAASGGNIPVSPSEVIPTTQNNSLLYTIHHRSFAPWEKFGNARHLIRQVRVDFHGDGRGYSTSESSTSRVRAWYSIDLAAQGYIKLKIV